MSFNSLSDNFRESLEKSFEGIIQKKSQKTPSSSDAGPGSKKERVSQISSGIIQLSQRVLGEWLYDLSDDQLSSIEESVRLAEDMSVSQIKSATSGKFPMSIVAMGIEAENIIDAEVVSDEYCDVCDRCPCSCKGVKVEAK